MTFSELGLSESLVSRLDALGFTSPTPIQQKTIPHLLSNVSDLIAQAQTGTGKTAAFGLPIVERLPGGSKTPRAIILAPTRELALQVCDQLEKFTKNSPINVVPIYGGQSYTIQNRLLAKPVDIIVGTPGRVIDHLKSKRLDLSNIDYLVLDEADEMLTQGFTDEINAIFEASSPDKQVLLFSATMSAPVKRLAETYMADYEIINTKSETLTTTLVDQFFIEVMNKDKLEVLSRIIDSTPDFYGFIFCKTKMNVDDTAEQLINRGYNVEALHGGLSQAQRERVLAKFRKRLCTMLVVTDVAARGIDVSDLTHVINYAIPQELEAYVHRIGRTGRAGKTGTAITLISPNEFRFIKQIEKMTKSTLVKKPIPDVKEVITFKKKRLVDTISALSPEDIEPVFQRFSEMLLAQGKDIDDVLAASLQIAFQSQLSESLYKDVNPNPKRGRDGGGDRRGGGYRGGGRSGGDRRKRRR